MWLDGKNCTKREEACAPHEMPHTALPETAAETQSETQHMALPETPPEMPHTALPETAAETPHTELLGTPPETPHTALPETAAETPHTELLGTPPETPSRRCAWVNLKNPLYVQYHDAEWGVPLHDDRALFELLILEGFQAGLSWECVLNKRAHFRAAYDGFDVEKVSRYGAEKIAALLSDAGIIRNRRKVLASIGNANVFREIQAEYGSFDAYIWHFTGGKTIAESYTVRTTSPLSDEISNDLKKRGMRFVGSTVIYSYLQSIGVLNAHGPECGCRPRGE